MELTLYLTDKKTNPSIKTQIVDNNVYITISNSKGEIVLTDHKKLGFWRDQTNLDTVRNGITDAIKCTKNERESLIVEYVQSLSNIYDPQTIPEGFEIEDNALYSVKAIREHEVKDIICYTAPWVTKIYINPDSNYVMVDVSFYKNKDEIATVTLPQKNCFERRGIMEISAHGALLEESKTQKMIEWLASYIHFNEIPQTQIFSQFGWKANNSFLVGNKLYTPEGVKTAKLVNIPQKYINGFNQNGTIEGWLDMTEPLLKYPMARFKCYAACAAPLLSMLHQSSMVILDFGESQSGKTITAGLGMSIWGNPDTLLISNYFTKVAKEAVMGINTDLPVFIDEMQVSGVEDNQELIYMIANGVGKGRGTKEGGLQEVKNWNTIALMTGEAPITDDSSFKGVSSRLLEVYGGLGEKNVDTLKAIEQYSTGITDHYGVFAPYVIDEIRNNPVDVTDTYNFLYKTYKELSDDLNESEKGIGGRAAAMFSVITLGGSIFETILERLGRPSQDPQKIGHDVFKTYIDNLNASGYSNKGYEYFMSWFNSKQKYFLANGCEKGHRTPFELYGDETDDYIDIFPTIFNKVMADGNFNKKRLIEDWRREGLLDSSPGRNQKKVRFGTVIKNVYRIIKKSKGMNNDNFDF